MNKLFMANTQNIACLSCKEYLDTDKFCPDNKFKNEYHGNYKADEKRIFKTITNIQESFLKENPNHYWINIITDVLKFLEKHKNHELVIIKDGGDSPWYESSIDWFDWKKLNVSPEFNEDIELPRNIIEDLGIVEWNLALKHYKTNCVFIDDPEKMKLPFLKHLELFKIKLHLKSQSDLNIKQL